MAEYEVATPSFAGRWKHSPRAVFQSACSDTGRSSPWTTKPIRRFEAWLQHDGTQHTLWPGVLELSQEFFDTLVNHAVPLDYRALAGLKHSALALDIYTWLAHRLC